MLIHRPLDHNQLAIALWLYLFHKHPFQLSKLYHPDISPNDGEAAQKFLEISEAYNVLGNDFTRCVSIFVNERIRHFLACCESVSCWSLHHHSPFMVQARTFVVSRLLRSWLLCIEQLLIVQTSPRLLYSLIFHHSAPIDPNLIDEIMTAVPTRHLQVLVHPLASGATHRPTHAPGQQTMRRTRPMPGKLHTTV